MKESFGLSFETEDAPERQGNVTLSLLQELEVLAEAPELSPAEIQERSRPLVRELLEHMEHDIGLKLSSDIMALYGEMQRDNLLARVESVRKVLECLVEKRSISVGSVDTHYANAVTPEPEGLKIAMAEADAIGPVRLLVGLDLKALIGFKNDHLEVSEIAESEFDHRDTGLRRSLCRHVSGEILPEDLRTIVLRIPRGYFPDELMTSSERKEESRFIFRGAKVQEPFSDIPESTLKDFTKKD